MITHTSDSHQIPSQSQSYKFKKIAKNSNFVILQETLHATHLLKLLDKMYKYEIESESDIRITTVTSYLALTGELWGVYYEEFGGN